MSVLRAGQRYSVSRWGLYQRHQRASQLAQAAGAGSQRLAPVVPVRGQLPRWGTLNIGTRQRLHKITPRLRARPRGRDALFALLRLHHCLVSRKRRSTKTTDAQHHFRKHPNLIKEALRPTSPDPLLVHGIIYLPTQQGIICLSPVTNAYSRRIVGTHVHASRYTMGCLIAKQQAMRQAKTPGVLHHLDRWLQLLPECAG